ncbi:hypothetical protein [Thalassospira alkalitolerans]|uniref:hypothetical protein n=1 Tax=Thalassospira alkalitolerans TaxID=1293890 RepID=UPI003AA97E44
MSDAVERVNETVNDGWLSRVPNDVEFIVSDEYGAGCSIMRSDLRAILNEIEEAKAENERLRAALDDIHRTTTTMYLRARKEL